MSGRGGPIDPVIEALLRAGCRGHGSSWTCPAHDDRRASLSVREGADGRVLIKCHAGCDLRDVLHALGLEEHALFPGDDRCRDEPVASYDYLDEAGGLLFQVLRYPGKRFLQRRPDGRGGWAWNLHGIRRVLYRLPEVLEAARAGRDVYVVEGEKDVHALEGFGLTATTNPGGAGKWRLEYAEALRGARVTVVADRDEPGRRHARDVEGSLRRAGVEVVAVLEPTRGKDIAEHLAAGGTLEELVPLGVDAPGRRLWVRASEVHSRRVEWIWEPYVPAGMLTLLAGRPGEGKSTIGVDLASRVSRSGGRVLFISAEDDKARVLRPRLEAAGADLERVVFLQADLDLPDGVATLRDVIEEVGATLMVLDPLNALIGMEVNSHRDHHVRRVLGPLAALAEETGAAVLVIGHLNKTAGEDPLMRVGGSVAYVAAARQVLVAAADPNEEGRRLLAPVKSNVAEVGPPLAYRIEGVELEDGIRTSRLVWLGEVPEVDVRVLLAPPSSDERTLVADVADALRAILADGPRPAREVERELREALGAEVSKDTLHRARAVAGVVTTKSGFREGWTWRLARKGSPEGSTPNPTHVEPSSRPAQTGSPRPEGSTAGDVRTFEPSEPSAGDVLALAETLRWPRLERPDGFVIEGPDGWRTLVGGAGPEEIRGCWDHLEGIERLRGALA